jgi:hypothetical protein
MKFIFLISLSLFLFSCNPISSSNENPEWLNNLIRKFESEAVGNPPKSIWQYQYKGQIVYYIPAQCCDLPSILYNKNGEIICAPDGGFSGRGDGRCTDFFKERSNEKLIWKDTR